MRKLLTLTAGAAAALLVTSTPALAQDVENDDGNGNQQNGNQTNDDGVQDSFNDLLDIINNGNDYSTDSSSDDDLNGSFNGNTLLVVTANQSLSAVNTNSLMDELVDLDGEDGTPAPVGYNSGDNYVRGNAFAAFAGISNNAWNTGINANTQAATNIAAYGQVSFAANGSDAGGGAPGGD